MDNEHAMARFLFENPDDLLENPRRRRKGKRRARARRRSARRRSSGFAAIMGGSRRKSRKRRRRNPATFGRKRRGGGRRRNPFGISLGGAGGSVLHVAKQAGVLFAAEWAGDFAATMLRGKVGALGRQKPGYSQMIVGLAGAWLLKRFGGPLRAHAHSFALANVFMGLRNVVPFISGGGKAASMGLGDVQLYGLGDVLRTGPQLGYTQQQSYGLGDYLLNSDVSAYAVN